MSIFGHWGIANLIILRHRITTNYHDINIVNRGQLLLYIRHHSDNDVLFYYIYFFHSHLTLCSIMDARN